MFPDGVAIFYLNPLTGEEVPVEFSWGTDTASIERVWEAAIEKLSANDAEELRREGYYARLVSLAPLAEEDLGQLGFIESCLESLEFTVDRGECTSTSGNEKVTQTLAEATLQTDTVCVPLESHKPALPEFTAEYLDCREEGDIEMSLHFILQNRTATHVTYAVQECDPQQMRIRGKMTASNTNLQLFQGFRRRG